MTAMITKPRPAPRVDLDRYRKHRAAGLCVLSSRYRAARPPLTADHYADALVLTCVTQAQRYGLEVAVSYEHDRSADYRDLGDFTGRWSPDVLVANPESDRVSIRYFEPSYTVAQRRADLSRQGVSRAVAQVIAERGAHDDMEAARQYTAKIVTVTVRYGDVELAQLNAGDIYVNERRDDADQVAAEVAYDLADEAVNAAIEELESRARNAPSWLREAAWEHGARTDDAPEPETVPLELLTVYVAGQRFPAYLRRDA